VGDRITPHHVIGRIDDAVAVAIGIQIVRRAKRRLPAKMVCAIHNPVVIEVAGQQWHRDRGQRVNLGFQASGAYILEEQVGKHQLCPWPVVKI
jgi:hypothetical protein